MHIKRIRRRRRRRSRRRKRGYYTQTWNKRGRIRIEFGGFRIHIFFASSVVVQFSHQHLILFLATSSYSR